MKSLFKIFTGAVLAGLALFLFSAKTYSQQVYFVQSSELFKPLYASVFESKIGISSNIQQENLKLDIGASVDLIGLRGKDCSVSLGAEFFTFSNLRKESNFKFPVDAIDYYFGIAFNYKRKVNTSSLASARLRIAHISSHFEDGHKFERTDTIFPPVVYSREFIELAGIYDYKINKCLTLRSLLGANILLHSIPDDFGKVSIMIGNELRYSISNYFGLYLSNELRSASVKGNSNFNESFESGINIGGFDSRGVNLFFSLYNGQDYKGQYYDKPFNVRSLGMRVLF
ncbi:MAG: DUF1207 domain-containing protein [Ignavibacteria bacterium]|nr:DUF1207 domain-containing protein [Ignavibacteria bacterium]